MAFLEPVLATLWSAGAPTALGTSVLNYVEGNTAKQDAKAGADAQRDTQRNTSMQNLLTPQQPRPSQMESGADILRGINSQSSQPDYSELLKKLLQGGSNGGL